MKNLTNLVFPMICIQALCLALGLWLQHQFLGSMVDWQSEQTSQVDELAPASIADAQTTDKFPATQADADSTAPNQKPATVENNGETVDAEANELMDLISSVSMFVYPISFFWIVGLQAVAAYMVISRANIIHSQEQKRRREDSLHQSRELIRTRDAVIFGLAKLADSRDPETGMHLERIAIYSTRLASALRHDFHFKDKVSSQFVKLIGISSALHDIGKVGISDSILKKAGPLTPDERKEMQEHSRIGGDCIETISKRLGASSFLEMAKNIAFSHHEKWDGKGYPNGTRGEEIPLAARIVAIADVYDALSSKRVYKDALSHDQCVEIISNQAGTHFDPEIVNVFLKIENQFRKIRDQYSARSEPTVDLLSLSDTSFSASTSNQLKENKLHLPIEPKKIGN